MKKLIFLLFLASSLSMFGQTTITVPVIQEEGVKPSKSATPELEVERPDTYQLYLKEPIKRIKKIEYSDDGTPIKFEMGNNGKNVYLKGYTRRGSVKMTVIDAEGKKKEIKRSPCYIDPVIPS